MGSCFKLFLIFIVLVLTKGLVFLFSYIITLWINDNGKRGDVFYYIATIVCILMCYILNPLKIYYTFTLGYTAASNLHK